MSETSDQYERDVANHINGTIKGLMAERPKVSTSFPDVRMKYKNLNEIWLEVKMNHTDNMMNPRFSYVDGKWITPESYKSPGTDKLCEYWNASQEAKAWIDNLKIHLLKNNFLSNKWRGRQEIKSQPCRYLLYLKIFSLE